MCDVRWFLAIPWLKMSDPHPGMSCTPEMSEKRQDFPYLWTYVCCEVAPSGIGRDV